MSRVSLEGCRINNPRLQDLMFKVALRFLRDRPAFSIPTHLKTYCMIKRLILRKGRL